MDAMSTLPFSPHTIARVLGGEASGNNILAPGPGHSRKDRSLSITVTPGAPDGFVVDSFAGDPWTACKDHVRERLGLDRTPAHGCPGAATVPGAGKAVAGDKDDAARTARALELWPQSRPPQNTPVQAYLERRGLTLPEAAEEAIRYHAFCPFAGKRTPAMVALVRDIITNKPKAVHRTALTVSGEKVKVDGKDRLALGPIGGGAVKLTPDEDVTLALGVGEGLESSLSLPELPEFGPTTPVWALLSAGALAAFPPLSGVETLWVSVDHDPAGERAAHTCADRWRIAGREVFLVRPRAERADLNDVAKGRRRHAR